MVTRIAWKNIWRNEKRSGIMIAAIAVGLWGGLFAVGIFVGMYDTMVSSAIDRSLGHLQLHAPGFREERLLGCTIPAPDSIALLLKRLPGITGVSERTVVDGMVSSPKNNQGATILGIDPADEQSVTTVHRQLIAGTYLDHSQRLPVLVGRKLAEKLGLGLRGKLVLTFQIPDGTIISGAFRIVGIFDTEATLFDGMTVIVRHGELDRLLGQPMIHEIVVRLSNNDSLEALARTVAAAAPGLRVASWKDLAPELKITAESSDITMSIFLGIILIALLFGITNTMLMSVLDRTREFGMLMAVGMKRTRVFGMVVLESLFLSLAGSALGVVLGSVSVALSARTGIKLSWFSEGLSQYGISSTVIPVIHDITYPVLGVMIIAASIVASLYPASKAVRLNPASAIAG